MVRWGKAKDRLGNWGAGFRNADDARWHGRRPVKALCADPCAAPSFARIKVRQVHMHGEKRLIVIDDDVPSFVVVLDRRLGTHKSELIQCILDRTTLGPGRAACRTRLRLCPIKLADNDRTCTTGNFMAPAAERSAIAHSDLVQAAQSVPNCRW